MQQTQDLFAYSNTKIWLNVNIWVMPNGKLTSDL